MSIEKKIIEKEVFITSDGEEFLSKDEAVAHESGLKFIAYYKVNANPDLTEGRHGPKHIGYMEVVAGSNHDMFAEHAGYKMYGSKVSFCMGVFGSNAIIPNWSLTRIDHPDGKLVATVQDRFCNLIKYKEGVNKL